MVREFSQGAEYPYDRSTTVRWIVSHPWRHRLYLIGFLLAAINANALAAETPVITGIAFGDVLGTDESRSELGRLALIFLLLAFGTRAVVLMRAIWAQVLGNSFSRDAHCRFAPMGVVQNGFSFSANIANFDLSAGRRTRFCPKTRQIKHFDP
jgi:ABC-type bacteriocin/lantibiotic exporter with double-glycine peptidase domain